MAADRYSLHERESSVFSRWVVPAVIVSLVLHLLLAWWARQVDIRGMSREYYDTIVPRTFQIERAEIDPKLLEPDPAEEKTPDMAPVPVDVPEEKVAFETLMADPGEVTSAPKIERPKLDDKPAAVSTSLNATEMAEASGARSLLDDPQALTEALLADKPSSGDLIPEKPLTPDLFQGSPLVPEGALQGGTQPGFSNLDELLARTGPLSSETAPILMPTDLLFDYDSAELRGAAVESLSKLATLIQRNPQSKFLIEGHTDSFGSASYNLELSTRRADSVRAWLVGSMGIPPERVSTRGLGESQLIAPASGTVEEQQINRRVEIVIQNNSPN